MIETMSELSDNTVSFQTGSEATITYEPGDIVGEDYILLAVLARGGMGVLFTARHRQMDTDRIFALKLLEPSQLTGVNWRRFEIEGKALARLEHPNVVKIFNMGVDAKSTPFYVMERLVGQSMTEYLKEFGPMSLPLFIDVFLDVCAALKYAHAKGIVHRDIKPANIFLVGKAGRIETTKVVDFGIAKFESIDQQGLTRPGEVFGSPQFMSPEQTKGLPASHFSDIYSLGCSMFNAVMGKPPFRGANLIETMTMHQVSNIPELHRSDFSARQLQAVDEIIATCMQKNENERFADLDQIISLLKQIKVDDFSPDAGSVYSSEREEDIEASAEEEPESKLKPLIGTASAVALLLIVGGGALLLIRPWERSESLVSRPAGEEIAAAKDFEKLGTEMTAADRFLNSPRPLSVLDPVARTRTFSFPRDLSIGSLSQKGTEERPAKGKIILDDRPIIFRAGAAFANFPPVLKRFDHTAIETLILKDMVVPPDINLLKDWVNLRALTFEHCTVTFEYLTAMGKLSKLESLAFYTSPLDGDALAKSGLLHRLQHLKVEDIQLTSAITKALEAGSKVKQLEIRNCAIADHDLAFLRQCGHLTSLDLRHSTISPACFESIALAANLQELNLSGARYDQKALLALARCKHLQKILLDETVDVALKNKLKAAIPGLQIEGPST